MRNSVKFTTLAVDINIIEMVKDKIEAILKEKGMTKGELAEKIGVSPQSLSRSLKMCSPKTVSRIASVLGVEEKELTRIPLIKAEVQEVSTPQVSEPQPMLNGYVECRGNVFRIATKEDLYKVIAYYDGYTLNKEEEDGE